MNYKTMLAKVLGEKELMEMNVQTIKDDEMEKIDKECCITSSTTDFNQCWGYNWLCPKMKFIKNIIKK